MKQGLRQRCVFVLLLFKVFFAVVINVACACLKADKDIMDALVHLGNNKVTAGRAKATAGESALATSLWGVLYADNAVVVS